MFLFGDADLSVNSPLLAASREGQEVINGSVSDFLLSTVSTFSDLAGV